MKVGLIMGSTSDWGIMSAAAETLEEFGITCETRIMSAHRTPDLAADYAKNAKANGFGVIIPISCKFGFDVFRNFAEVHSCHQLFDFE